MDKKLLVHLFDMIMEKSALETTEPTAMSAAIGSIHAYAEIGSTSLEGFVPDDHEAAIDQITKEFQSEMRSRTKIIVYLASNGEKECVTIDGKLPFENATMIELKEAQKIVRKRLKTK